MLCLSFAIVAAIAWALNRHFDTTNRIDSSHSATADTSSLTPSKGAFDNKQYSLTDPTSIWVVANKHRALQPKTYAPNDLVVPAIPLRGNITNTEKYVRKVTAVALEKLEADAQKQGLAFNLQSGYRSYDFQVDLYNRYVQQQGQAVADSQSARPGFSEHQTGLAADLGGVSHPECDVEACFATTPEGEWLAANAYQYGFIIRYPQNMQTVTGYIYEPWHVRYVGVDLATQMHKQKITTLEQSFALGSAPDYE